MNSAIATAARAAADQLESEGSPGLRAGVEAVLAVRQTGSAPPQYADPVGLASLVVSIASLAWTVYIDLRKREARPRVSEVVRQVRHTRIDAGREAPIHLTEVVATEVIRTLGEPE